MVMLQRLQLMSGLQAGLQSLLLQLAQLLLSFLSHSTQLVLLQLALLLQTLALRLRHGTFWSDAATAAGGECMKGTMPGSLRSLSCIIN